MSWCMCASRNCRGHHLWKQFARARQFAQPQCGARMVFDTAMLAAQYALSGEGVALLDTFLFGDHIHAGRLVKPFSNSLDDGYGYYLITHPEGPQRYRGGAVPFPG